MKGLQIAPEFYKMLSGPLKDTPLGQSMVLQQQILDQTSRGLGGQGFGGQRGSAGQLPPDMVSAIGENLASQQAASGTTGSPAGAISAAMRFSGASEQIRAQRLQQAQSALGQIGGASIMPSSSEFLQVGANKAAHAADIQTAATNQEMGAKSENRQQLYSSIGSVAALAAAPFTGGASLALMGAMGGGGGMFGGGGGAATSQPQMLGGVNYGGFQDQSFGGQAMGANSSFYGDPYGQQARRNQLQGYWGNMPTY